MAPLQALRYARKQRRRSLDELKEFVRFPSVSSQVKHAADLTKCAAWLVRQLRQAGLQRVRMIPTAGHPIVYGSWERSSECPTVLIYGHYDVQPADPLGEWRTPPFDPQVRGEDLYGRGACDDKGQMLAHVKALEAYLMTERALPLNIKCVFEGEEEIGSPHLRRFIGDNREMLQADAAVVSDTRMLGPGRPAITYAERGMLGLELEVRGPDHDLHSGNFGGAIHNPLQALCEMIATFHDAAGRVAISGFYGSVRNGGAVEREYMARTGPSDEQILRDAKAKKAWGERGYTLYERTTLRPALTINGLSGGYQGSGIKGVIPARALAKLSFRLVADQDPEEIEQLFREHIKGVSPSTVRTTIRVLSSAKPAVLERDHAAMKAAAFAYRKAFGSLPVFLRSGGTIPVVNTFQETLQIPTVLMGFALPDDRIHAPNEKFHLPNFYRGIESCIWFLLAAAANLRKGRHTNTKRGCVAAYGH